MTIQLLRDCLSLYVLQTFARHGGDKSQARRTFQAGDFGLESLQWMLNADTVDPFLEVHLMNAMAFVVVSGSGSQPLWDLLALRQLPVFERETGLDLGHGRIWKKSLVMYILDSEAFWVAHKNPLATMLPEFLRMVPRRRFGVPLLLAAKHLARHLEIGSKAGIHADDYDRFVSFFERTQREGGAYNLDHWAAILRLAHPFDPRPKDLLALCRGTNQPVDYVSRTEQYLKLGDKGANVAMFILMVRLAQVCEAHSMYDDARWVLSWAYDKAPDLFAARAPQGDYGTESLLLPREATRKEIENGIDVDANGYVIHSPRLQEWYFRSRD